MCKVMIYTAYMKYMLRKESQNRSTQEADIAKQAKASYKLYSAVVTREKKEKEKISSRNALV